MKSRFPESTEVARISKSGALGNRLEWQLRIAQKRSGKLKFKPLLILERRKPGRGLKGAYQIARTHVGELSQTRQADGLGKMRAQPILDSMHTRVQVIPEREINTRLIVTAISPQKNYEVTRNLCSQSRTVMRLDNGQRHVDA